MTDEDGSSFADSSFKGVDQALLMEVWELARQGNMIAAIKRYREETGCDLVTAKGVVEGLLATAGANEAFQSPGVEPEALDAEILDLAVKGGKITAIKRYREVHGCGLKEAKDQVEGLLVRHGVQAGPGQGCAGVLLLMVGLGIGCWWCW